MAPAGVVGRPATMALNARSTGLNDFGSTANKSGEDRPPHTNTMTQGFGTGTKAWSQSNIWGTSTLGTGFGPAVRDASRTRENGTYLGPSADSVEGKTGSSSLVPSSESDSWTRNLSPWGSDANHSTIEQRRGSAVSPARQRGNNPQQGAQQFQDNTQNVSPYFSLSRNNPANPTNTSKPVTKPVGKPLAEPNSNTFALPRQFESPANGFSTFNRFADMEGQVHRPETHAGGWGEADSMQSPTDDRGSIANSEYFGATSAAQSRSGSLPPSRHGEPSGPLNQPSDTFSRFQQGPVRGHTSSFSSQTNGRSHQERSGSIQSDSVAMFGRLSIDANAEQPIALHKPSVSVNGSQTPFTQAPQDGAYQRGSISEASQGYLRTEEHHLASNGGTFTPENFPVGQYSDHVNQLRAFHLTNRGTMTPNGSEFRQSPFYSVGGTPPVFDHLYPSRNEHAARAMSNASPALLERKLRGLQQQEQQGFLQSQYQQMLAAAHFRTPYNPYQYTLPNGLPVNGLAPVMPTVHTVMQVVEPPKGPRELEPGQAIRSALLEEFKANSKTNKRYELKDIYDHIVEFSGDQHGSRFIQQKLETANSDEKDRVFKELQIESLQLMQDVFGNYVIQKFFEHGDQNQKKVLASKMKGQVLSLSLQMYGCRVVQKALEHILTDQQASLIRELENHVLKCVKDQNGNHVIQKAIERVPAEHIQFIINAFTGQVGQLATHPYGCRVIQRMLEYCEEPAQHSILQELHACGPTLISDQYGNYVTQHVIEHGSPDDRAKIIDLVKAQLLPFSKHKFASNVVEKCLVFSNDQQRKEIMQKVVEKTDRGESGLTVLIRDGYGNYVIQKLLDTLNAEDYATFLESLQPEVLRAKRTISGKQIQSVEKKMHRFDRGGTGRSSISSHTVPTEQSRSNSPPAQKNEEQPAMDDGLLDNKSGSTTDDAVPAVTASADNSETVKPPAN